MTYCAQCIFHEAVKTDADVPLCQSCWDEKMTPDTGEHAMRCRCKRCKGETVKRTIKVKLEIELKDMEAIVGEEIDPGESAYDWFRSTYAHDWPILRDLHNSRLKVERISVVAHDADEPQTPILDHVAAMFRPPQMDEGTYENARADMAPGKEAA